MAKGQGKEPDNETPMQRFERLARKLVAVPKREADKMRDRALKRKARSL